MIPDSLPAVTAAAVMSTEPGMQPVAGSLTIKFNVVGIALNVIEAEAGELHPASFINVKVCGPGLKFVKTIEEPVPSYSALSKLSTSVQVPDGKLVTCTLLLPSHLV